jgi:hypothetical protein
MSGECIKIFFTSREGRIEGKPRQEVLRELLNLLRFSNLKAKEGHQYDR